MSAASSPSKTLRDSRLDLALTQREFAVLIGVDMVTIGKWENGSRLPRPCHLRKLAEVLRITPAEVRTLIPVPIDPRLYTRRRTKKRAVA